VFLPAPPALPVLGGHARTALLRAAAR
jgi:hypothetical protein